MVVVMGCPCGGEEMGVGVVGVEVEDGGGGEEDEDEEDEGLRDEEKSLGLGRVGSRLVVGWCWRSGTVGTLMAEVIAGAGSLLDMVVPEGSLDP